MDYIETVVKYILNTDEEISWEELNKRVSNISIEGSEIIMTIAERLIQEGIEKGIKEGMEKGKEEGKIETMREMIEFALELKFGMSGK